MGGAVCYMTKSPEGILGVFGGGYWSNRECIKAFLRTNPEKTWKQWYGQGWRAVRVVVTEQKN